MVTTLMGIGLLLLAAAVVALFAMIGELRDLIGDSTSADSGGGDWVEPIDSWEAFETVDDCPPQLEPLLRAPTGVLLVLSTSCTTCDGLAGRGLEPLEAIGVPAGVVISTSNSERATRFLETYPAVRRARHYVDVGGDWTRENLKLDMSPCAVVLDGGKPRGVWAVSSAEALASLLSADSKPSMITKKEE